MSELLTISDPAEDAALLAARLYSQSRETGGYDSHVGDALTRAGLADLVSSSYRRTTVTLDPEGLAARVSGIVGTLEVNMINPANVADAFYSKFYTVRDELYSALTDGELTYTTPPVPEQAFDPEALLARYGATGALPRVAGDQADEIERQRRVVARACAIVADTHSLCASYDQAIARTGLGNYAPDKNVTVSATVPGAGEVTAVIATRRSGTVRPWEVAEALSRAVTDRFGAMIDAGEINLPEGALIS